MKPPGVEIKPCPFCGHSASIEEVEGGIGASFTIGCDNPDEEDCMGYQSLTVYPRKIEAINAWNRRATEDAASKPADESLDEMAKTAARMTAIAICVDDDVVAVKEIYRSIISVANRYAVLKSGG